MATARGQFPSDVAGLAASGDPEVVALADGQGIDLRIAPVAKRLGDFAVRMLAYNGSVPGPVLKVAEGSTILVDVENQGDLEATVHWHGLRLDSQYDGTHEVQEPIPVGSSFRYRLEFPDPGLYWYHPHVRQDYGQEMGLYGTILVEPAEPDYWPAVHRELVVTLDDILLADGAVAPFNRTEANYAAMGRFGDMMLVNGEPKLELSVAAGEVVRFYLVNTANTRVFNVAVRGGRMKLVGGDSGRCEREQFVESTVLGPSQRAVVDVLFDGPGEAALEHRTPDRIYELATVTVADTSVDPGPTEVFATLRTNAEMIAERERIEADRGRDPDETLAFVAELDFEEPEGPVVYSCPMHPDVVSDEPGKCPRCGMKLVATAAPITYTCPMHPEVVTTEPGNCPQCGMKLMPSSLVPSGAPHAADHGDHGGHGHGHATSDGIEWEDDMVEVNRTTTASNTRWKVVDQATGDPPAWRFRVGDRVKIRLVNEMESDHPMHHPFHIHGAGRFLVLSRDGVEDANLVWTDTVMVRTGEVVDILLDVTHPGRWMAHCHIAEHHESGMVFGFDVAPA
jgi:FtsP/CotA-like multicopper oxidase with cupredoxin domain